MSQSLAEQAMAMPADQRLAWVESLDPQTAEALAYDWDYWARPEQLPPPGDWVSWLIQAGRGWGKTRVGAEWVRAEVEAGQRGRFALVARTAADTRDVMVEGSSGLLSVCPPWNRPKYEPSKRRVTWANGALATLYSADEPDLLRGPQHDGAWVDELASWRFPDAWDQLQFGLRLGTQPQVVVTTTPRPTKLIRELAASPTTRTTRGRSVENKANLAAAFFTHIVNKYQGTRLGRQELEGEILDDNPNALWKRADIEKGRLRKAPQLLRIVIPIDPAVTSTEDSDETGIVPVGVDEQSPEHYYVLEDRSLLASPDEWATAAVQAYLFWEADRIIGEANNGGDMIESTVRHVVIDGRPAGRNVPFEKVTASRGKAIRAEPVAALYEQGRVHHVGFFPELEDQLCEFDPLDPNQKSPDRMDSLVWGITALMGARAGEGFLEHLRTKERSEECQTVHTTKPVYSVQL